MPKVVLSLHSLIPPSSTIFEIGLGTGYFAGKLLEVGHFVEGIQPRDEMLKRLRTKQPKVVVIAEEPLESFRFQRRYDVIVSHSSVFLFTKHVQHFGASNEVSESLVFQSFIWHPLMVFENLLKTVSALEPSGRLFINVQENPRPSVDVGPPEDPLKFEMLDCKYFIEEERVIKHFKSTFREQSIVVEDVRYCVPYSELVRRLGSFDIAVDRSADGMWVVLTPKRYWPPKAGTSL